MGFMRESPILADFQTNLPATPGVAEGTLITSNAAANTKGAYATLIASTNFDVWGMMVIFSSSITAATIRNHLVDIAIGAAGSEQVIAANMLAGNAGQGGSPAYFLPLFVPKGTRISARGQDQAGNRAVTAKIYLHGGPNAPPWNVYQATETIGITVASSSGAAVAGGATAGVEGTWTNLGSVLAHDWDAYVPMIQCNSTTVLNQTIHFEIGINSVMLSESQFATTSGESIGALIPAWPQLQVIPAGTQMMVRSESDAATGTYQYALLGFY